MAGDLLVHPAVVVQHIVILGHKIPRHFFSLFALRALVPGLNASGSTDVKRNYTGEHRERWLAASCDDIHADCLRGSHTNVGRCGYAVVCRPVGAKSSGGVLYFT